MTPSSFIDFGKTTHYIKLLRLGDSYRWQRDDGALVSPTFATPEAAHYMAGKIPFLTDAEWREYHPLPADPSVDVRCIRLIGQLVEAGTDVDGQTRMTILTTEAKLMGLAALPLYIDAEISFSWPIYSENKKPQAIAPGALAADRG